MKLGKKWIGLVITLVIVGAVSAFLLVRRHPTALPTLSLGYRPNVVVDLALLLAIERGDFRRAGLEVRLAPFGRADLVFGALGSGEIDGSLGVPLEPVLNLATKGKYPYRAFRIWYFAPDRPYDGLLVSTDSPVRSLGDLKGKTVGSFPSRQISYFVSRILPESKVEQYNPATSLLNLESGSFAAIYVLDPVITQALRTGRYRLVESSSISRRLFNGEKVPAAVTLLSDRWIRANPEAATKFLELAQAAYRQSSLTSQSSAVGALLQRREFGGFPSDIADKILEPASSAPEELDRRKLELYLSVLRQGGLLEGPVDFDRFLLMPSPTKAPT